MSIAVVKAYEAYPMNDGNHLNNEINAKRVGYQQGYEKCLEETEALPKINVWIGRDKDGLHCFSEQPERGPRSKILFGRLMADLPNEIFPEMTTEIEPIQCEFLIRKL